jgi:hypothetical protein
MKGQFFVISTVIMIYALMTMIQYIYDFSDINLVQLKTMTELDYIQQIKDVLYQTTLSSNSSLDCNKVDIDLKSTEDLLEREMISRGISLTISHTILNCPPDIKVDFDFSIKSSNIYIESSTLPSFIPSSLVGFWRFDDGFRAIALDSSGYDNDGTLLNIYPLDVIASNPSLEDPWSLINNQDANHRIESPNRWTVSYSYDTSSTMLSLEENSIVKDNTSSNRMKIVTGGTFVGSININDCNFRFPINENMFLEGGNFQYAILGPSSFGDQTFHFYDASNNYLCRRWAYSTELDVNVGGGWRIQSFVWQPSSLDPNLPTQGGDIPYIPQGAAYACFQQYYSWHTINANWETIFDKFFVYQWTSMPTNEQRINRASSGWVNGKYNYGLRFDGINDYLEVPYDGSLQLENGNFTFAAWINGTDNQRSENIYIASLFDDFGFRIAVGGIDNLGMWYRLSDGSTGGYDTGRQVLDNTWHHIAVTKGNNVYRFYDNGAYVGGTTLGQGLRVQNNVRRIGAWTSSYGLFRGVIDEVKFWNRSLSDVEIISEYS